MAFLLSAGLLAAAVPASGCDLCGSSSGNLYLGLLPQQRWHFAGLQYLHNTVESTHQALFGHEPDEHAVVQYQTAQLWGRYNPTRRLQTFYFLPYRINRYESAGVTTTSSGLGDVSLLVNYLLVDKEEGRSWPAQLLAGGGVKLPTGAYTGISELDQQGLPNIQPGTGSWDFLVNANYTIRHKKWGANADASYTITTPNRYQYKYGNRLGGGVSLFRSLALSHSCTLLPQAGIRLDYALHDYDNYARRWLNELTGGSLVYAAAGVQAYYRKTGLRLICQQPLVQDYGGGNVRSRAKWEGSVFFLFK